MSEMSSGALSGGQIQEEDSYRSFSGAALLSLLVSGLALTAFLHPVLWFVAAASALFAGFVLVMLSSQPEVSGRSMAVIGLVISLFSLGGAVSRYYSRQQMLYRHAREYGENWFALVKSGEVEKAFELTLEYLNRKPKGANLKQYYKFAGPSLGMPEESMNAMASQMISSPASNLRRLFGQGPLRKMVELGSKVNVEFLENVRILRRTSGAEEVHLMYRISFEQDGRVFSHRMLLITSRTYFAHLGEAHWKIVRLQRPDLRG